jgi:hypothetical protein
MATQGKDTLYIDAEDEITAVIDKVVNSKHKIVAIVLPKRATVFHSVVNLKLLKKAAASSKKNIALITSDSSVMAIAGSVGIHVAKTPSSKPIIPVVAASAVAAETINLSTSGSIKPKTDESTSSESEINKSDDEIELDNTSTELPVKTTKKNKKSKKIMKIPDFSKFTTRLGFGIGALVLLIVLWVLGFVVLPSATVTINTDVSTTTINSTLIAQVGNSELDLEDNTIPAERVQVEKIDSVTVPATGEKNVGNKATGRLTLTNCIKDNEEKVIPAGTVFSKNNLRFLTSEQIILGPAAYVGNNCISADFPGLGAQGTVDAIADAPGTEYNVSEGSFVSSISGIQAFGSDMTGGTSETVKVVSQEDIDNAVQSLNGVSKNDALNELKAQLSEESKRAIDESLVNNEPSVVSSSSAGTESQETTVTMTVNYSMLGVSDEDLNKILDNEIQKNLGDEPVNIRNNGLDAISFRLAESTNEANTVLTFQTVATIGPEINQEQIKQDIVGKKRGDIEKQIESIEGVRSVSVEYSPVWITTTPKSADKISIVIVEGDENQ